MMEIDPPQTFSTKDDEIRYWTDVAQQMHHRNEKLKADNEHLRIRLSQQMTAQVESQAQIQELKRRNEQLISCVRKLEQKNDDLEKINRESRTAEVELEMQFNAVLEKLALLETDVDEKEGLKIAVQRLKDENTDLKQQIQVDLIQQNSLKLQYAASNMFQFVEKASQT